MRAPTGNAQNCSAAAAFDAPGSRAASSAATLLHARPARVRKAVSARGFAKVRCAVHELRHPFIMRVNFSVSSGSAAIFAPQAVATLP